MPIVGTLSYSLSQGRLVGHNGFNTHILVNGDKSIGIGKGQPNVFHIHVDVRESCQSLLKMVAARIHDYYDTPLDAPYLESISQFLCLKKMRLLIFIDHLDTLYDQEPKSVEGQAAIETLGDLAMLENQTSGLFMVIIFGTSSTVGLVTHIKPTKLRGSPRLNYTKFMVHD